METNIELLAAITDEDIKKISTMAWEIQHEHYDKFVDKECVEYILQRFQTVAAINTHIKSGAQYFIIRSGQEECGYWAFVPNYPKGKLFLSKLYIYENFRGRKIASHILDVMKTMSKEQGFSTIWLSVNKLNPSVDAYKALGFEIIDSNVKDIGDGYGLNDYDMELKL